MKTFRNILFYYSLMLALAGYVSYEFSDSPFSSGVQFEIPETQTESESRECEERTHVEEYSHSNTPEIVGFFFLKKNECCFRSHFNPVDYTSLVWTPPKHS